MNNDTNNTGDSGLPGRSLRNTAETEVKVSERLHQDIMRAVRLAEPAARRPWIQRFMPAWGVGIAGTAAVLIYLAQTPVVIPGPPDSMNGQSSWAALEEKLTALPQDAGLAEEQLRKELDRIKSDLQRFRFGG